MLASQRQNQVLLHNSSEDLAELVATAHKFPNGHGRSISPGPCTAPQ
jgi:hypothetical protein